MSFFKGQYVIEDGYVGGDRPQQFAVQAWELEDDMTDEQLEALYESVAEECFRENIGISVRKVDQFVAWAREQLNQRGGR